MPPWKMRLQSVLESWTGTPWVAGQQLRGPAGGVDCVRFVVAVLDELHRCDLPAIPRLPQDMSLHTRAGAMRVMHAIEPRYPHVIVEPRAQMIEAGDVIIVQLGREGGPGHAMIAGRDPRELWHAAAGAGVCRTSAAAGGILLRIWRPTQRETW